MRRRRFLQAAAAGATASACGMRNSLPLGPAGNSAVSILRAKSYSVDLVSLLKQGAAACGLNARGKRVLLKPNLVEFDSTTAINTHVSVIAAAVELFRHLGAADVRIGEGPGHRRDTLYLASEAKYPEIEKFESLFVDLNRDDVSSAGAFGGREHIYLPNTVLQADLIVSLAKMKTHHWAAATLSMKNYFGLVPGSIYGWPKNELHRVGIPQSIAELNRLFGQKSFAIVDGIIGMEGNGPIQGTPKPAGVLVMGSDLIAVDATCCRIMGIDPELVDYIKLTADRGHTGEQRIEQRGETIASVRTNFQLVDEFSALRLS
jgi:uncharacterized protein (DUF362 family)